VCWRYDTRAQRTAQQQQQQRPSARAAAQVPIAVWAIANRDLRTDRFYGTHPLTHYMLCCAGGFFLHDAVSCLLRESPFYIVHGLTCCLGYTLGAAYGCGHFYGGLFLMWEVSTPFVQLRWVLYKMGLTETILYKLNGIMMVLSFGIARVFFGTCAHLPPAPVRSSLHRMLSLHRLPAGPAQWILIRYRRNAHSLCAWALLTATCSAPAQRRTHNMADGSLPGATYISAPCRLYAAAAVRHVHRVGAPAH
jgi:TLC domain